MMVSYNSYGPSFPSRNDCFLCMLVISEYTYNFQPSFQPKIKIFNIQGIESCKSIFRDGSIISDTKSGAQILHSLFQFPTAELLPIIAGDGLNIVHTFQTCSHASSSHQKKFQQYKYILFCSFNPEDPPLPIRPLLLICSLCSLFTRNHLLRHLGLGRRHRQCTIDGLYMDKKEEKDTFQRPACQPVH